MHICAECRARVIWYLYFALRVFICPKGVYFALRVRFHLSAVRLAGSGAGEERHQQEPEPEPEPQRQSAESQE